VHPSELSTSPQQRSSSAGLDAGHYAQRQQQQQQQQWQQHVQCLQCVQAAWSAKTLRPTNRTSRTNAPWQTALGLQAG
jgi:hypothetical protein